MAARYDELLKGVGDLVTPKVAPDRDHVYHLYVIRTEQRDALKKHLADAGIATVLNYPKALPFYPAYAYLGHRPRIFRPRTATNPGFCPCRFIRKLSEPMITYVAGRIREFFERTETASVAHPRAGATVPASA